MDGTAASSGGLRVGKLLPKGLSAKRRRRKDKNGRDSEASGADDDTRSTSAHSSQRRFKRELTLESDDANSTNIADDDDDEMDDRSFGSFESGADPETADRYVTSFPSILDIFVLFYPSPCPEYSTAVFLF